MRRALRPTVDARPLRPIHQRRLVAAFGGRSHVLSLALGCAGTEHDAGSRLKTPGWRVLAGIALGAMGSWAPEICFGGLAGSEADGVAAEEGGVEAIVGEDLVTV